MAAYTLYELVYRVARELGIVTETTATGGSNTTIADSVFLGTKFPDDFFNAGTAFILYDAGGAGAAPQGEWGRITDFATTSGTVTFAALTAAVAAGDRCAIAAPEYTLDQITQAINMVLAEIPIEYIDDTTIDTDDNKTEYDLPAGLLDHEIRVFINTNNTTDENYYVEVFDWTIEENATGSVNVLIFNDQPIADCHVRIIYKLPHPPLYARTDKLRESININRVVLPAAYRLLVWKRAQKSEVDAVLDAKLGELYARMEAMRWKHSITKDYIKLNTYGYTDNIQDGDYL